MVNSVVSARKPIPEHCSEYCKQHIIRQLQEKVESIIDNQKGRQGQGKVKVG